MKMISTIFLFIFLLSCSNLEFIYKNQPLKKTLYGKINAISEGDENTLLLSYFKEKMGSSQGKTKYLANIYSIKSENKLITAKDGSTSKLEINFKINYELTNIKNNCLVYKKIIVSSSIYNSKSSGYNFGTDISKKEIITKNIKNNVDDFIKHLSANENFLECLNENKS